LVANVPAQRFTVVAVTSPTVGAPPSMSNIDVRWEV
jgi:hypothetical protein